MISGGADFDYDDFGVGGSVYHVRRLLGDNKVVSTLYANVGATYWILPESVAAGVRWAYLKNDTQNTTRVCSSAAR